MLDEYNCLKVRLAFGRRDSEEGQEALCGADLQETDADYMYSQNEPDSSAVIQNNTQKRYDNQVAPFDIESYLEKLYDDNDVNNQLYH